MSSIFKEPSTSLYQKEGIDHSKIKKTKIIKLHLDPKDSFSSFELFLQLKTFFI